MDEVLQNEKQFDLELSGLNIFPTSVYVQVFDLENRTFNLHQKLNNKLKYIFNKDGIEGENFIPHIAILSYNSLTDQIFFDIIKKFRDHFFGILKVKNIHLVRAFPHRSSNVYEKIHTVKLLKK
jgi:2'-5' RNA ligase